MLWNVTQNENFMKIFLEFILQIGNKCALWKWVKKSVFVVINIFDLHCCVPVFVYFIVCMDIDDYKAVKRSINIRGFTSIYSYP